MKLGFCVKVKTNANNQQQRKSENRYNDPFVAGTPAVQIDNFHRRIPEISKNTSASKLGSALNKEISAVVADSKDFLKLSL